LNGLLYEFARTAITKYHRLGAKQQKCIFLQFWSLEIQDQGRGSFGFFWGFAPWLTNGCLLSLCICPWCPFVCPNFLFVLGHQSDWIRLTLIVSFELNHSLKGPIFKYIHILSYLGLGHQHQFWRNAVYPITLAYGVRIASVK